MRSQRSDWLSWTPMLMACRLRVDACQMPVVPSGDIGKPERMCLLVRSK